ncbi:hypothetical protein BV25DRAFT_1594483 [Artomyces pyxidatus]|uniref:Uncharacterized protein n=1 Tax=Artomyces pyxidatus TaxID=48021 RepID=A0ACB8TC73_9AGAM|nr:hypothetical protein BV25DRAFT_1594483 [Artomyces pyxidatus]
MVGASLSTIPNELSLAILCNLDSREDVLSFSLLSKHFRALTAPHHLEYREIRLTLQDEHVWTHLARSPGPAANVYKLVVYQKSFRYYTAASPTFTPRLPATLVRPLDPYQPGGSLASAVEAAARNMRNLKTLEIDTDYEYRHRRSDTSVVQGLVEMSIGSLEHLTISGYGLDCQWEVPAGGGALDMSQLKTFIAPIVDNAQFWIDAVLKSASNLQVLNFSVVDLARMFTSTFFADCRFPALRDLTWESKGWQHETYQAAVNFLCAHPTLERLQWERGGVCAALPRPFLPRLRHLRVERWPLVSAVLQESRTDGGLETLELTKWGRTLMRRCALQKGSGSSVRRLSFQCWTVSTLREMAAIFPGVRELHLEAGLDLVNEPGIEEVPTLADALECFPNLEVVGGMRFRDEKHMGAVLASFPRIERFEDPRFSHTRQPRD